jgi:1A family penicillin-binding protein
LFRRTAVLGGLLVLTAYVGLYLAPLPHAPDPRHLAESTKILDREGRLLYDSAGPADAHYTYVPLAEIPASLRWAVIATEDASFYSNPGIDPAGILRAALANLRQGGLQQGGSTITQQLARNLYFTPEERSSTSPWRKLKEITLALRLSRSLSKDQVLEQYLNRAYFGNLAYGVEAASRTYFGKSVRDLDLAESALLAGLLQSPADYDPFTRLEAARARQRAVLRRMTDEGYITAAQAEAAAKESIALNRAPFPVEAPHFVAWVRDQLPDLVGEEAVAAGGLRVFTSLDLDLQQAAEVAVTRHLRLLKEHNVTDAAAVAIDPATGQVLAMVGSADYFDESIDGAVNMALAPRQPGSAIKPIIYAAALEAGFTPATPLLDTPAFLPTRQDDPYSPSNYDATFHGLVPLREALASSYNVPAVRVLAAIGVDAAVRMGQRLGLTTLKDPSRYDLSFALGGGEVRLLDLTAAYAVFAAGGLRADPVAVTRIEDSHGRLLYQAPRPGKERVVSPQTAYLLTDILSDNDARAPGFGLYSPLVIGRPAAAKTGTTTDFRDNWTVGYTPSLAVGVWVGNARGTPMKRVSGIDGAAPIWHDIMVTAHQMVPPQPFPEPEGIIRLAVCLPSGLLPTPYCQRQRTEVFAAGSEPSREDDYYRPVLVCEATGQAVLDPAATDCPGRVSQRVYAFVPPEAIPWARAAGVPLPPVPPYSAAPPGQAVSSSPTSPGPVVLAYPADGSVFRLSREVRAEDQALLIEALPSSTVLFAELYVDQIPVARLESPPYRAPWPLTPGVHRVSARAVDAAGNDVWSATATVTVLPP